MSGPSAAILPLALNGHRIVTVESQRHPVNVRYRTRWYAVARRKDHEGHRHWCANRPDALVIAEWQREAFKRLALAEQFQATYDLLPAARQSEVDAYLKSPRGQE